MGHLNFLKVFKLSWKLKKGLICIKVPLLLEINTLLDEYASHGNKILIGREVLVLNFFIVVTEVVLRATHDTEVWACFLLQTNWDFHACKLFEVGCVFHFFEHNTLFHLTNIFFFNDSKQSLERWVDLGWVKLVAWAH